MATRSTSFEEELLGALTDPEEAAAYVAAGLRDSKESFLAALRDVAKAHKMAKVAEEAEVERGSLYRMLSANGNPNFDNLSSVLDVMGLSFVVVPKAHREDKYTEDSQPDNDAFDSSSTNAADDQGEISALQVDRRCLSALIGQIEQNGIFSDKAANVAVKSTLYWAPQSENNRSLYEN